MLRCGGAGLCRDRRLSPVKKRRSPGLPRGRSGRGGDRRRAGPAPGGGAASRRGGSTSVPSASTARTHLRSRTRSPARSDQSIAPRGEQPPDPDRLGVHDGPGAHHPDADQDRDQVGQQQQRRAGQRDDGHGREREQHADQRDTRESGTPACAGCFPPHEDGALPPSRLVSRPTLTRTRVHHARASSRQVDAHGPFGLPFPACRQPAFSYFPGASTPEKYLVVDAPPSYDRRGRRGFFVARIP